MKAVMLSIRPEWCAKIANGTKTIEVRKTKPKLETPFKCYIYCTKPRKSFTHGGLVDYTDELYRLPNGEIRFGYSGELMLYPDEYSKDNFLCGKVIGEFVCDRITYFGNVATDPCKYLLGSVHEEHKRLITEEAGLTEEEMLKYKGRYGWHISELKIYDEPKELSEFLVEGKQTFDYPPLTKMKRPPQSWCYVEGEADE